MHLVKQKYASPLDTFCKFFDKHLSGDQKPIEGEVVEDDMVTVTAAVQIVADHSAQIHTSPNAMVPMPEIIARQKLLTFSATSQL